MTRLIIAIALVLAPSGCEVPPATPSDSILVPYQFNIEYSLEEEAGAAEYVGRARLYDIAQAYDITGNAGTIELSDGDAVFADGVELDIETRTTFLNILRVDYSQTIAHGEADYPFELRRPGNERIAATIPIPEPFVVADIDTITDPNLPTTITWDAPIEGATLNITILPITDGCLTVVGGGPADVVKGLADTGEYRFDSGVYHSTAHDCEYELIFERRTVTTVPGTWHKDGGEYPANEVYAVGLYTVRATFIAAQR